MSSRDIFKILHQERHHELKRNSGEQTHITKTCGNIDIGTLLECHAFKVMQ